MIDTPKVIRTEPAQTAVIRVTVLREQIREVMGPGIQELLATVAAQGVATKGAWFTYHFRMDPVVFDFEIGIQVERPITPSGRVKNGSLPTGSAAHTVYHGPYEGLPEAWGAFDRWCDTAGHQKTGALWEVYSVGPESGGAAPSWQTDLYRPLIS